MNRYKIKHDFAKFLNDEVHTVELKIAAENAAKELGIPIHYETLPKSEAERLLGKDSPQLQWADEQTTVWLGEVKAVSEYSILIETVASEIDESKFLSAIEKLYRTNVEGKSYYVFSGGTGRYFHAVTGPHAGHTFKIVAKSVGDCGAFDYQVSCSCGASYADAMNGCWQCGHQRQASGDESLAAYSQLK